MSSFISLTLKNINTRKGNEKNITSLSVHSISAVSFLSGCTGNEDVEEVNIGSVPYYIPTFIDCIFLGKNYLHRKAQKEKYPYTAYLTNNIEILFSEEGYWNQVNIGEEAPGNLLSTFILVDYSNILEKYFSNRTISSINTTPDGERLTLNDNKQLASYSSQTAFKGYNRSTSTKYPIIHQYALFG